MPKKNPSKTPQQPGHEPVGRPRRADYGKEYQLRMSEADRVVWTERAKAAGLTLAHWIRLQCVWAAGGSARIVRAEFVTTYPEVAPPVARVEVSADHPIRALRDAVDGGLMSVRTAVDELLADDSTIGRLIAAEIAYRVSRGAKATDPDQESDE